MLKFYRYAAITKRIFDPIPEHQPLVIKKMESGFEDHHLQATPRAGFSRTPRKMTREQTQFRTRTQSIASNGSQGSEAMHGGGGGGGAKQVKNTSLYKTELCRSFEETGMCRYGKKCQFAHSKKELRVLARHPKYKTDMCKSYHATGYCPYGTRCHFIHDAEDGSKDSNEEDSITEKVSRVTLSDSIDWPSKPVKAAAKPNLTKTATLNSLNSMGSEKSSVPSIPSVESIWSSANSATNLASFDLGLSSVWNDSFLSPRDERQQTTPLSLGALDFAWDGLTFASSITNSDRDSLSPDQSGYKSNGDIDIPNVDEIFDDPSRLSVFRTLSSNEK